MKPLFFDPTGPVMRYADGALHIADLNPEVRMLWRVSRTQMLRLGWRCMLAALSPSDTRPKPMGSTYSGEHGGCG